MSDRLVLLFLTGSQVNALRQLGVLKHGTRRCKDPKCGTLFVPTDQRQEFCDPSCGKYQRQAKWLKAQKKAARAAKYSPLDLQDNVRIDDTPLPLRVKARAADAGLVTVGDVRSKSDGQLLLTKRLGLDALKHLRRLGPHFRSTGTNA